MKKKIVCSILVIAMSLVALVGCGVDYSKADMSVYATFDYDGFQGALNGMVIEEPGFTDDEEHRMMLVHDALNEALARKADTSVLLTEGKPDSNDIVYFCYYISAVVDGECVLLSSQNMKVPASFKSASHAQLGINVHSSSLEEAYGVVFDGLEFNQNYQAYTSPAGEDVILEHGTVVYLSYTREHEVCDYEGVIGIQRDVYNCHRVVLDKDNPFHAQIIGKNTYNCPSTLQIERDWQEESGVETNFDVEGYYSKIKIEFVEQGRQFIAIRDNTYEANDGITELLSPSMLNVSHYVSDFSSYNNGKIDASGLELTYHIYPIGYIDVPDVTAENIINYLINTGRAYSTPDYSWYYEFLLGSESEPNGLLDKIIYKIKKLFDKDEAPVEFELPTYNYVYSYELIDIIATVKGYDFCYKADESERESFINGCKIAIDGELYTLDKAVEKMNEANIALNDNQNAQLIPELTARRDSIVSQLLDGLGYSGNSGRSEFINAWYLNKYYVPMQENYTDDLEELITGNICDAVISSVNIQCVPKSEVNKLYRSTMRNLFECWWRGETFEDYVENAQYSYLDKKDIRDMGFKTYVTDIVIPVVYECTADSYSEAKEIIKADVEKTVELQVAVYCASEFFGIQRYNYKDIEDTDSSKYDSLQSVYTLFGVKSGLFDECRTTIIGSAVNNNTMREISAAQIQFYTVLLGKIVSFEYEGAELPYQKYLINFSVAGISYEITISE